MLHPKIRNLLRDKLGLEISSIGPVTLERAVGQRLRSLQLADQHQYLRYLASHPGEIDALIEEVVIPETWFFRDRAFFDTLARIVFEPPLAPEEKLKVLSVPCATGEEPYSIAITLLAAGRSQDSFLIDAVDISQHVLDRARRAVYGRRSFRQTDPSFQSAYFHETEAGFRLVDSVKRTVRFHQGNIASPGFMSNLDRYHLIFCKNILIYLNQAARLQTMDNLKKALLPDGRLFAGLSETGLFLEAGFTPVLDQCPFLLAVQPRHPAGRQEEIAERRPDRRRVTKRRPLPALPAAKEEPPVTDRLARARLLADQGKFTEARKLLTDHQEQSGPSAEIFFLLGVIAEAENDTATAVALLRKALYLDPDHQESLGLMRFLSARLGDVQAADRYRQRLANVRGRTEEAGS